MGATTSWMWCLGPSTNSAYDCHSICDPFEFHSFHLNSCFQHSPQLQVQTLGVNEIDLSICR